MSNDTIAQPYKGDLKIDLTAIAAIMVYLAPGVSHHLRKEQPGYTDAVVEIKDIVPVHAADLGISLDLLAQFIESNEHVANIDEARDIVGTMMQVLDDTRAYYDHKRQSQLSLMVDTVKATARRLEKPALKALLSKTMKYFSQVGDKAARTRRLRAETSVEQPPQPPADDSPVDSQQ